MPTIYEAIPKIMKAVGAIKKDKKNTHDKYQYRSIDAVYNSLQPHLASHGVFITPQVLEKTEEKVSTKSGVVQNRVILSVKYTLYAEDASHLSVIVIGEGIDRGDKASNKALQAAFKYMVAQVFCIAYEENLDADNMSPEMMSDPEVIKDGKYKGYRIGDIDPVELQDYINGVEKQIKEKKVNPPAWFVKLKKQVRGEK